MFVYSRLIWSLIQYSLEKKVLPKYSDILLVFQFRTLRLISVLRIIGRQKGIDVEIDSTSSHTLSSRPNGIIVICLSMSFVAHSEFIAGQDHPKLGSDISGLENKFKQINIGRYHSFSPLENVFSSDCFSSYSPDTN